jgi:hypothetical protein
VKHRLALLSVALVTALTATLIATRQVSAQQGPDAPRGRMGFISPMVCSTTDYTDVAAKALGMTAPELRVALVSGKTLQDLATSKNVTVDAVMQALNTAFKADLDQAVKDGLITQAEADALQTLRQGRGDNRPRPSLPVPFFGGMALFGAGISHFNVVRPLPVAAQAIGMTCPDLAKTMAQGDSIVHVATTKNVKAQTVIDALVKAYQDATAQDVKEGLITQAQADARNLRLVERVTAMISQPGGRMGMLRGPRIPRGPRQGGPGDRPGGQPGGGPQGTPEAPPQGTPNAVQ